jgi:hypothetical protein
MKRIVGLVEKIELEGERKVSTMALFDSGAKLTSVDTELAAQALLGPITRTTKVRNASYRGFVKRPVVKARITVMGQSFEVDVNVQDRSHMAFHVLIGRNILKGNFLVDPKKNYELYRKMKRKAKEARKDG